MSFERENQVVVLNKESYLGFLQVNQQVVLVMTSSCCPACFFYCDRSLPLVAKMLMGVSFGKVVLEADEEFRETLEGVFGRIYRVPRTFAIEKGVSRGFYEGLMYPQQCLDFLLRSFTEKPVVTYPVVAESRTEQVETVNGKPGLLGRWWQRLWR